MTPPRPRPALARTFGRLAPLPAGLLALAWPLPWTRAWPVLIIGVIAMLAGAVARPAASASSAAPSVVAAAAITLSVFSRADAAVIAAEGMFILAYLLLADAPSRGAGAGISGLWLRWLRRQLPILAAGLVAAGAVLGALAYHPPVTPWLAVAGLVAAAVAYVIAVPRPGRRNEQRGHPGLPVGRDTRAAPGSPVRDSRPGRSAPARGDGGPGAEPGSASTPAPR